MGLELPTRSPVLRSALKGIARSHAEEGTKKRTRLPISWERILQGEKVVPTWERGVRNVVMTGVQVFCFRSDEVFASDSGVVHLTHCIRRDGVAFFEDERQLDFRRWRRANKVELRFQGHKDQLGEGSVIVRTRAAVSGAYPGLRLGAGAVPLMVELMPCHPLSAMSSVISHVVRLYRETPHFPPIAVRVELGHGVTDKPCGH